jgi:hypothetical protein
MIPKVVKLPVVPFYRPELEPASHHVHGLFGRACAARSPAVAIVRSCAVYETLHKRAMAQQTTRWLLTRRHVNGVQPCDQPRRSAYP